MSQATPISSLEDGDKVKSVLERVYKSLKDATNEVETASELARLGVKNELIQKIEEFENNPFKFLVQDYERSQERLAGLIDNIVISFITIQKSRLDSAYLLNTNSDALVIALLLKEDTNENRDVFYDFLDELEELSSKVRPVVVSFVQEGVVKGLDIKRTLL
ncbi:hypothetical protein AB9P05_04425 [Roseivirga sp. BDSF3-8]|uniref:hypothetical protein n=1 Tax=Roseivirga sp. BDSF3-8 TaxID=3241598 RepID=UPI0035318146